MTYLRALPITNYQKQFPTLPGVVEQCKIINKHESQTHKLITIFSRMIADKDRRGCDQNDCLHTHRSRSFDIYRKLPGLLRCHVRVPLSSMRRKSVFIEIRLLLQSMKIS